LPEIRTPAHDDVEDAEHRRAIELDPANPSLHIKLADLLSERNLPLEALEEYGKAIELAAESASGYSARAALLTRMKAFDAAMADHRRAIELSPNDISLRFAAIATLQAKGDFVEAERYCRAALELDKDSARGWECLGAVLQTVGKFDDAAACFRRSLEIRPSGIVSMMLAKMPKQTQAADIDRVMELQKNSDLPTRDRVAAGFALGDLLDQSGRFDAAFAAYSQANALMKDLSAQDGFRFDGNDLHSTIDELIETFAPGYFAARSDFGHPSELPVFIVGMPRSGTSLVEQIAASHSKIFGAGELLEIPLIRARVAETIQKDSPRHWQRHWHRHLGKVHLAKLAMLGGAAERVTDKLPVNILNLGLIAAMFPQARVIFCERNPLDTCLSCFFQLFDKNNLMFSYDLLDCAKQYIEQQRLTAHWKRVLPLRMLSVQYEELVSEAEPQSRRLIEFLGVDWEPACLASHKSDRPVLTKSVWQVRQPVYTRSVSRWMNYKAHLGPLEAALADTSG
jgi:predicted TPR repeat methyltransferase